MKAITPPKLMPPFHSTTASGMLPIEHTNEMMATRGPMSGPHTFAASGWPAPRAPAVPVAAT